MPNPGTYHGREGEDGYPPSWMREGGLTMVGKGRMGTRHLGLNGGTYHGREGPPSWIEGWTYRGREGADGCPPSWQDLGWRAHKYQAINVKWLRTVPDAQPDKQTRG